MDYMPRTALTICMSLYFFVSGCACHDRLSAYRYSPFQFVYPEYHLKAEVTQLSPHFVPEVSAAHFDFFGLQAVLPPQWEKLAKSMVVKENQIVYKSADQLLMISLEKENLLGCQYQEFSAANKDFCTSFGSMEEYYWKLYTLTPEGSPWHSQTTGDKLIIHQKGFAFELMQKIEIYKTAELVAFRSDYKPGYRLKTQILIFSKRLLPNYVVVATTISDEEAIRGILSARESKPPPHSP